MVEADIHLRPLHTSILDIFKVSETLLCCLKGIWVHALIINILLLEEFVFVLVLILTLVLIGLGRRIGLGSKILFYLLSYLFICHLQNYGLKTRKFPGRGKDPLPVSLTKRYFKPRSIRLSYGTICIFIHHRWKRKHVSVSISRDDGNGNMFPLPRI